MEIEASPARKGASAPAAPAKVVERGEYLVDILGCSDCHTPLKMGQSGPEPDMSRRLSGHPEALRMPPAPKLDDAGWAWAGSGTNTAFAGPWGVTHAPNLTPGRPLGAAGGAVPTHPMVGAASTLCL